MRRNRRSDIPRTLRNDTDKPTTISLVASRITPTAKAAGPRGAHLIDAVDPSDGVFITAEGLLMYLQPQQALELIAQCATRFPGGQLAFDLPPAWFAKLSRYGGLRPTLRYKVPPMSFSLSSARAADLVHTVPGIRRVRDLQMPSGRGLPLRTAVSIVYRTPFLDPLRPCLTLLEFV